MWFATDNGISRFNGNQFLNFTYAEGLCVRTLFGIFEDKKERIWFYSFSGKVVYFDYRDQQIHCPDFNTELATYFKGTVLNGLFVQDEVLHVYNYSGDEVRIDLQRKELKFLKSNEGLSIHEFKDEIVKLSHSHTNLQSQDSCRSYYYNPDSIPKRINVIEREGLVNVNIPSVFFDKKRQKIYYSTYSKLCSFDKETQRNFCQTIDFYSTKSLFVDQQGLFWVGSRNRGVFGFEVRNNQFFEKHHFLDQMLVTSVTQDANGSYWFTTEENGVYYMSNLLSFKLAQAQENLIGNCQIDKMTVNHESVFFSNGSRQVFKLDIPKQRVFVINENEQRNEILYIRDNTYQPSNVDLSPYLENKGKHLKARAYLNSADGHFMFAQGYNKSYFYKKNEKGVQVEPLELVLPFKARHVQIAKSKNIYFGNNYDLAFYDQKEQQLLHVKDKENKTYEIDVASIFPLKGDRVWVASRNRGLLLVERDSILLEINKEKGFPVDFCNHAFAHGNYLYVSSNSGIFRINVNSKNFAYKHLTEDNGLLSNEIHSSLFFNGFLYLATNDGINRLDTALFNLTYSKAECILEEIRLNGEIIASQSCKWSESNDEMEINLASNSFENALNGLFRYRLNSNEDWRYTNDSKVFLVNLLPGDYRFEAQSSGVNKAWGASTFFKFQVPTPYYQTYWFYLLIIGLSLLFAFLIFRNRIRNANRLNGLRSSLMQAQNHALSAQMNPHFIFNSLNSISNGILSNDTRSSVLYIGKFGKLMRTIFENSEETFISLKEELEAVERYLELEKLRLQEKLTYELSIAEDLEIDAIFIPALLIQPFLENAIWHGVAPLKKGGNVKLSIAQKGQKLEIKIEDNGVGMEDINQLIKKAQKKSALQITFKRLKLIEKVYKEKIEIRSELIYPKQKVPGTAVYIRITLITTKP